MWLTGEMEYHSIIKKNEGLTQTTTQVNLEALRKRSQTQRAMVLYDSMYGKYPEDPHK